MQTSTKPVRKIICFFKKKNIICYVFFSSFSNCTNKYMYITTMKHTRPLSLIDNFPSMRPRHSSQLSARIRAHKLCLPDVQQVDVREHGATVGALSSAGRRQLRFLYIIYYYYYQCRFVFRIELCLSVFSCEKISCRLSFHECERTDCFDFFLSFSHLSYIYIHNILVRLLLKYCATIV